MTSPTPEERRKELADAFADGLDIYEGRRAERDAKTAAATAAAKAAEGKGGGEGDNDGEKFSLGRWLLG
jgi:hypothetical protein